MTAPQGAPREAGREMDEAIAEHVMGWRVERITPEWYGTEVVLFYETDYPLISYSSDARSCNACMYRNGKDDTDGIAPPLPSFSDDIAAAWLVAEAMARLEPHPWMLTLMNWDYYGERTYSARFTSHPLGPPHAEASADSPALAICQAALTALTPHPTPKDPQ